MKNPLKRLNRWTDEHLGPALIITSSLCTFAAGFSQIYANVIGHRAADIILGMMIASVMHATAATVEKARTH